MENRAVDRLFNLLSSPSAYLRNESIDQIFKLAEESSFTNLGLLLEKIRRSISKNPESSWETRIAAAKCVEKLFSPVLTNRQGIDDKIRLNFEFDLQKTINIGLILAANEENFATNDAELSEQRRKFDQQLNNVPGFKLDTSDWVSDSDFEVKTEQDLDHPVKISKHNYQQDVDQLEKILLSSKNFDEIFQTFYNLTLNDLLNPNWTIRHAAGLQMKSLTKFLPKNGNFSSILEKSMENLLICLSCDNFNDFVDGSKVVAPVRETVAQVFAQCVNLCDFEVSGSEIVRICRQFFQNFDDSKWKILHSGFLLAKYLLPTIFAQNTYSLPENFENFLVDICQCVSIEHEDIINACCETLSSSLGEINQKFPNLTTNLAESCWIMLKKSSFDPLIDEWPGALLKILRLLIELRSEENLTPNRLSLICKFLTYNCQTTSFETAVSCLYFCAKKFGVESWSEPGLLHVLRCLFVRRLVVRAAEDAESQKSFALWSLLLENQPKNLVLKPFASYFCQFLNFVMVADHYPSLDSAIFQDLATTSKENGAEDDVKFFLSGQDVINLKEEESYARISATKMELCRYLAVWSRKTYAEKIALPEDQDGDPNWLILVLNLNLRSNSSIRRTIIYMLIVQWLKIMASDREEFPQSLDLEDVENAQVFEECLPLLAQLNTQKANLCKLLKSKIDLDKILNFPALSQFYLSDFNHVTLLKSRLDQGKMTILDECRKFHDLNIHDLEISIDEIQITCQKILRHDQISRSWRTLCVWRHIFLNLKILPPKLSNLIGPLMKVVKDEIQSPKLAASDPLVVETLTIMQILLRKILNVGNLIQLKEKLITNLIFIHTTPQVEKFKLEDQKSVTILDYQNLIQNLQYDDDSQVFKASENDNDSSKMSGEILKRICQDSSTLDTDFPILVNVLNFLSISHEEERKTDVVASLQLASTLLTKLPVNFRSQYLTKISPNLLQKFLVSNSNFVRTLTCGLIGIIAEIDRQFFLSSIFGEVLIFLDRKSSDLNVLMGVLELILTIFRRKLQICGFGSLVALPCLGLMSHKNECIRAVAATCFSLAVKLMPLERNLHENEQNLANFSPNLRKKLENQREFSSLLTNPETLIGNFRFKLKNDDSAAMDLRQYQKEGVCWMIFLRKFAVHGILGDDMGLGKTLQTLCCLADFYAASADRVNPSLIICPKTLVEHWRCETEKFFDKKSLKCTVFDNLDQISRFSSLYKEDFIENDDSATLVVVSYDTLRRRSEFFATKNWAYCVLDEGHVIRNWKSTTFQAIMQIKAKHRLILSGTPIQNNLLELWSLFEFLMPGYLGDRRQFNKLYNKVLSVQCKQTSKSQNDDSAVDCKLLESSRRTLQSLHKLILPFILRRRKCDVLKELPPKIVQNIFCPLSNLQSLLYRDFTKNLSKDKTCSSALQILTFLRKLCDHPCLVLDREDAEKNFDRYLETATDYPDLELLTDYRLSGKMMALMQLLTDCGILRSKIEEKLENEIPSSLPHRALIFCQFKSVVDLICSYFDDLDAKNEQKLSYLRFDGTVSATERQNLVTKFNENSNIDVLVLTTSIGGLGLNLTGADVVIFVDHDWNPAKDLQAMDRAHRLGQQRTVNVYRLISKETLEEKILRCQNLKLDASQTVICDQNTSINSMNTDQLFDLLCNDDNNDNPNSDQSSSKKSKKEIFNMAAVEKLWDQSKKEYEEAFDVKSFVKNL